MNLFNTFLKFQVRSEKALLEKQEQMLKLREEQLIQERRRQEKLREEAQILRRQEEEIRRRQEEIAKELMQSDMKVNSVKESDVIVCQAREGQVFVGRKPQYTETVLDRSVVDVQMLNTSDWDTSDAESIMKDVLPGVLKKSFSSVSNKSTGNTYRWGRINIFVERLMPHSDRDRHKASYYSYSDSYLTLHVLGGPMIIMTLLLLLSHSVTKWKSLSRRR